MTQSEPHTSENNMIEAAQGETAAVITWSHGSPDLELNPINKHLLNTC